MTSKQKKLPERIRELSKDTNVLTLAKKAGLGESSIRSILKGSSPSIDKAVAIARAGNVDLWWLATGEGEKYRQKDKKLVPSHLELVTIRIYNVLTDMEGDYSKTKAKGYVEVEVSKKLLKEFNCNVEHLHVVEIQGESMEPRLNHGDRVFVDTDDKSLHEGCIYIFTWEGRLYCKKVHFIKGKGLKMLSFNPNYEDSIIPEEELKQVQVAGRVVGKWDFF